MSDSFEELGVPLEFIQLLASRDITEPTPIQAVTLKDAMHGKDLCGRAPTGSGKTIAFGIPVITGVAKAVAKKPTGLILAPTRELAEQITTELQGLAQLGKRSMLAVYGGTSIKKHKNRLNKGVDILVACPGRLKDLLQQKALTLDNVSFVVIDEADRMADMGFLPEVKQIVQLTKNDRQTILFSATLDGAISELTRQFQNNPIRHEVGSKTPDMQSMEHFFWKVNRDSRVPVAANLILQRGKTIVFTRTRYGAERAAKHLKQSGIGAVALHGGKTQYQRDRSLRAFTDGEALALVCTDVAARGIHIDNVDCVLHYDPPEDSKAYIHRSGRTARAGAKGIVVCFVDKVQHSYVKRLQRDLQLSIPITDIQDTNAIDEAQQSVVEFTSSESKHESKHVSKHDRDTKKRVRINTPRRRKSRPADNKKTINVKKRKAAKKQPLSNIASRSKKGKIRKRRKLAEPRSRSNSSSNSHINRRRRPKKRNNKY